MDNKPIHKYSMEGEYLQTYPSITLAARLHFGQHASLIKCTQGILLSSAGFRWSLERVDFLPPTRIRHSGKWKPVDRVDPTTGEVKTFESMKAAAEHMWTHRQNINHAIKSGKLHIGYYWRKHNV